LTTPPAIAAAREAGIPAVCTIRDYWPVCYWSDLIYRSAGEDLCPMCSAGMMTRCIRPRAPRAWPLAVPLIPYMRSNLRRKRLAVSHADAVIAVSTTMAADLRARAPELARSRIEIIPNPLDVEGLRAAASACEPPLAQPYAIYVGKLAPNKGVSKLLPATEAARLPWPLVVVGDGPDRAGLERTAAEGRRDVRFLGWLPREEALRWLRYAAVVVFPSRGPESLSRVLLEASALERPIAAINTGGTPDIIIDEQTGLLSQDVEGLATDIAALVADPDRAARLGEAALVHVQQHFDTPRVVARVEALYEALVAEHTGRGRAPK
jgi:glycosyltransferase involved in cell wall biosynthesis